MNAIIYYSNTKESYKVASYIKDKTNYELFNIFHLNNYNFDLIYLIFPIHYQSIPKEIRPLIKKIVAKKAIIIATYGKMSYGNVLNDTKKILNAKVVGAAYIPTKHTYLINDTSFDLPKLDILINKMNNENEVIIKKGKRNPFAQFFPLFRHQIAVKIIKTDKCVNCNHCHLVCNLIKNGNITNKGCNRCLKCVNSCPYNALEVKLMRLLRHYLKKPKKDEFIVY